jgi:dCTP deaminase
VLSGDQIRQRIESGEIVIDPAPTDLDQIGVAVDLTLGRKFWKSNLPEHQGVEIIVDLSDSDPYEYMMPIELDEIVLAPGQFVLGVTSESIALPLDVCAWIEGKSGRSRQGLVIHLTAPKIDPGWGLQKPRPITLEIVNHFHHSVRLKAGAPIAQLLFHELDIPAPEYSGVHSDKGL